MHGALSKESLPSCYLAPSEHPSKFVFANLLVQHPSPPEYMFHERKPVRIPAGPPCPLCIAFSTEEGLDTCRVLSVFLSPPSGSVGTVRPGGPACCLQEQTPQPKIHPVFTALFPILASHVFQDSLFGWAPG